MQYSISGHAVLVASNTEYHLLGHILGSSARDWPVDAHMALLLASPASVRRASCIRRFHLRYSVVGLAPWPYCSVRCSALHGIRRGRLVAPYRTPQQLWESIRKRFQHSPLRIVWRNWRRSVWLQICVTPKLLPRRSNQPMQSNRGKTVSKKY